ncbi:TetR/AcrR family transcriptional regulator [Pseudomonas folii]|uniref:TetR/AcrR family transcriptional regulator n=1 Tax=Pseudomonas folii TaxID=2762593 RepID=A0ABR7B2Y1_9PSED|nr:TetR/AcrR family transcriptional regulator [Pseudomonas folii]MBC3951534.1 TetR/AcrR family transcriptional regulator [Pseudomonas folii]
MKVRTESRRTAIVETAASVFLELGYEGASMKEVSTRLGGSKATLYGYFASKEALFVAVVQMYATSHLYNAVADLTAKSETSISLEEKLLEFGRQMLMIVTNDSTAIKVYRMVLAESGRSDIGKLFYESGPSQGIDALATLMSVAIESGELRPGNPRVRAKQFLSLITAEPEERLFQQNPAPMTHDEIEQMVTAAVDMFLNGAAPH